MANQVVLTLENLKKLDFGAMDTHFKNELRRVVKDLEDRPGDPTPRKIALIFIVKPLCHPGTSTLEQASVEMGLATKLPEFKTRPHAMSVKHDGSLAFHPDLPDEPEGSTLFDEQSQPQTEGSEE